MKKKYAIAAGILCLIIACLTVGRFIWSDFYVEEFNSDSAEISFWAQACLDAGSLVNPDFTAAYFIPFGGQLIMIPIVKLFGVGINPQRLGMSLNGLLFIGVMLCFLKILFGDWDKALFLTAGMTLCLCASSKLREIFWGHVIYYSLAPFFLMGALILLKRVWEGKPLWSLCLWIFLGSADGTTMLVFFTVPLLAAWLLEAVLSRRERRTTARQIAFASLSGLLGLVFYKFISRGIESGYADQFMVFLPESEWLNNLAMLARNWISLFMKLPKQEIQFISSAGVGTFIALCFCFALPLFTLFALKRYHALTRLERLFCICHLVISFVTIFCYLFGNLYIYNHRMIPMYWSAIILLLIMLRRVNKLTEIIGAALFALFALVCGISVLTHQADTSQWYGYGSVIEQLQANGLTDGYTLDFWNGNAVTLLSNRTIKSRLVKFDESGCLVPDPYQSDMGWYDGSGRFLICQERDAFAHPALAQQADKVIRLTQRVVPTDKTVGLVIYVFDHDIL